MPVNIGSSTLSTGLAGMPVALKTYLLTALAMLAFAANSLLCRLALQEPAIDAASFTLVRIASGAVVLALILRSRSTERPVKTDWLAAGMLFLYAILFSFAYLSLSAGTGALILFGAVKLTMFVVGLRAGEHFAPLAWLGLAFAATGLVYLVSPGVTAPSPLGAGLMAGAGVAWGVYSLRGRGVADPLGATAGNFLRALPLAVVVALVFWPQAHAEPRGLALAVASGALASGLGYVIWYAALKHLSATRAATVQLSVPVIAALGGVTLLAEALTPRLVLASLMTLGGIALVLSVRGRPAAKRPLGDASKTGGK